MAKSSIVAYVLWVFLGGFGAHLFYLRRDRQAFAYWATFGFLGAGWFRDLFCIPRYVLGANDDERFIREFKGRVKKYHRGPPFQVFRFAAELGFGTVLSFVAQYAVPDELLEDDFVKAIQYPLKLIGPVAAAIGVYVIANIGREMCSFKICLSGSLLALPAAIYAPENLIYCVLVSSIGASWKGAGWRLKDNNRPQKGHCTRVSKLTIFGIVYLSLWGSMVYFNMSITAGDGDVVKVRVAIQNFFNSPVWTETKEQLGRLYNTIKSVGWKKFFADLIDAMDPQGECNALKALDLPSSATQEEIKSQYRRLMLKLHPDRHPESEKEEAAKEFMKIQKAYELLSDLKTRRMKRTMKFRQE